VGNSCNQACDSANNFVPHPAPTATCNTDGTWSYAGSCVSGCVAAPSVNGVDFPSCANVPSTGTCNGECSTGYYYPNSGNVIITCQGNGQWITQGVCNPDPCTGSTLTFPSATNTCPTTASGDDCTQITCNSGYIPQGTLSATCSKGVWTSTGSCESGCTAPTITELNPFDPTNCAGPFPVLASQNYQCIYPELQCNCVATSPSTGAYIQCSGSNGASWAATGSCPCNDPINPIDGGHSNNGASLSAASISALVVAVIAAFGGVVYGVYNYLPRVIPRPQQQYAQIGA